MRIVLTPNETELLITYLGLVKAYSETDMSETNDEAEEFDQELTDWEQTYLGQLALQHTTAQLGDEEAAQVAIALAIDGKQWRTEFGKEEGTNRFQYTLVLVEV